ncbi:GntR family transcriptional regulator [Jannaschia marina]|uniref:GntR family transcriptional regulator n=1 Tax=Jannaschia marina TaxID=2741674 RepID=UPI0015C871BC|nr:GntR family transcriptional regulator [Jannaschia marina]
MLAATPFQPIDPARPAGPQIVAALRSAILRMEVAPGQALSEADLAQSLGTSRTPLRAALQELRDQDLVETRPSRGTYVTRLDAGRLRAAQFLREALEVAAVARLAESGYDTTLDTALDAALSAQAQAVEAGDAAGFQSFDDRFHALLAQATGHGRLAEVLAREKAQLDRLRVFSLSDPAVLTRLLEEHRAILAAVRAGDVETAAAAMRAHLRAVLSLLDGLVATRSEYFNGDPA